MTDTKRSAPSRKIEVRFFDEEERDLIESFEAALERGEVEEQSVEDLANARAKWREIALQCKSPAPRGA